MALDVAKPSDPAGITIEAWAQGYMAGSLIVMTCIAIANMRRHVLLHKLIVIEVSHPSSKSESQAIYADFSPFLQLLFGFFHGTFIFTSECST